MKKPELEKQTGAAQKRDEEMETLSLQTRPFRGRMSAHREANEKVIPVLVVSSKGSSCAKATRLMRLSPEVTIGELGCKLRNHDSAMKIHKAPAEMSVTVKGQIFCDQMLSLRACGVTPYATLRVLDGAGSLVGGSSHRLD